MNLSRLCGIFAILIAVAAVACQRPVEPSSPESTEEPMAEKPSEPSTAPRPSGAVGETSRSWIVEHVDGWSPSDGAPPDEAVVEKLASVDPGARVDVYLGTWCPDSRREVTRFWRALDVAGDVPFEVSYVGLDRNFEAGDVGLDDKNIIAVPTFIVTRDGQEVGRVVETSVDGIEADLNALLRGEASGMISASRGE